MASHRLNLALTAANDCDVHQALEGKLNHDKREAGHYPDRLCIEYHLADSVQFGFLVIEEPHCKAENKPVRQT